MNAQAWTAIIVALLGGGLIGGIALLLKVRPEAGQVVVQQAEKVVVSQRTVIDDLLEEIGRLKVQHEDTRRQVDQIRSDAAREINKIRTETRVKLAALREQLEVVQGERDQLLAENAALKVEVGELRDRVTGLEGDP